MQEMSVQSLGEVDPLEKEMVTHFSILAWKIPWTEKHGRQQSTGLQSRTWLKQLSMHACVAEGNGNPLQYSCLENPMDTEAWWVIVHGVAELNTTKYSILF